MRTFEVVLRRANGHDTMCTRKRVDAQIGDVVRVDGQLWVIVEKEPPVELSRPERLICVPRKVRRLH